MAARGWRFNGQQRPNAIHMCVTGPQTQAGLVAAFAEDLHAAVDYARHPPQPQPKSGGRYGGGTGTELGQADIARRFLTGAMDAFTDYPL